MSRHQKSLRESVSLSTGRTCELIRVRNEWISRYYLLTFPRSQGEPSTKEVSEMVAIGVERARVLALESVGDSEAYGLIYNGYSARREKGWHIQLILLGNRWREAWLYVVLAGKNLLQALRLCRDDAPRAE